VRFTERETRKCVCVCVCVRARALDYALCSCRMRKYYVDLKRSLSPPPSPLLPPSTLLPRPLSPFTLPSSFSRLSLAPFVSREGRLFSPCNHTHKHTNTERERERERERDIREQVREREREREIPCSRSLAVFFPPEFEKACVNIRSDCGINIVWGERASPSLCVRARVGVQSALGGPQENTVCMLNTGNIQYCHDLHPLPPADSSRIHIQRMHR
jgi:hypothetical protein